MNPQEPRDTFAYALAAQIVKLEQEILPRPRLDWDLSNGELVARDERWREQVYEACVKMNEAQAKQLQHYEEIARDAISAQAPPPIVLPPRTSVCEANAELNRARSKFGKFASAHEGYAVILEELDELKAEIWKKQTVRDMGAMRKEAIQVAAMALRFVEDVCDLSNLDKVGPASETMVCGECGNAHCNTGIKIPESEWKKRHTGIGMEKLRV